MAVNAGTDSWNSYFEICKDGRKYLVDFVQNTDLQKASTEDLIKANEAARKSALAHNVALKQQTLGAKAAAVGLNLLKTAANVGIFMLASFAINGIITLIDNVVNRTQKIKEAATEAKTAIKNIKSEFDSLKSSTEDVGKKFAELAQGVENLGKSNQSRGKLSTEDYDEFLDLSNQLAELYPQLTKGYDDNGNAILSLSGNVDTIVGSLNNLLAVQQKLSNQQILEKMPDVWAGYDIDVDEYDKKIKSLEKTRKTALDFISKLSDGETFMGTSTIVGDPYIIQKAIRNANLEDVVTQNHSAMVRGGGSQKYENYNWEFRNLTESQLTQLKNELGRLASEYQNSIDYTKSQISSANSELSGYINTWLSTEWNFVHLDSSLQNSVKDILINFDWTKAIPDNVDSGSWDAVSNWLSQNFLYAIQNINSGEIKQSLSKAFKDALSLDEIQKLIDLLKNTEGFDENNPLVLYLQTKIDTKKGLIESAKARVQDEYKDKVTELSDEDLQIAADLSISDGTLLTWDELKQKIQEVKDEVALAEQNNFNFTDFLNKTKEGLNSTFESIKLFVDTISKIKNGETLDYDTMMKLIEIDPSLMSDFSKTADGYSISIDKLIEANNKYKESSKNDIQQNIDDTAQKVAENEAKLKKLVDERYKLEAKVNANRDNDHYNGSKTRERLLEIEEEFEVIAKAIKDGKDAVAAYKLMLEEINSAPSVSLDDLFKGYEVLNTVTEEFNKNGNISYDTLQKIASAYPALKSAVNDYLLGIIDENELILKLSDCYSKDENDYYKYLLNKAGYDDDYINAALGGSDEIVNYYAENYGVDLKNFQTYIARKQAIQDKFDSYVAGGLSRYFDENGNETNEFLALEPMAKRGIQSIYDQYQNAINGLDAFELKDKTNNALNSMLNSSNNSNSSSSAASDTSKTFNWIEIAIEKVQKAASKLGNIVSNTFKSWTDRNNALKKQIKEVNKEIELQQKAYDAYTQKANSVGLSEYWANKVRNGSIDISVITDEDLADKIDEFKEWYENAPLYSNVWRYSI